VHGTPSSKKRPKREPPTVPLRSKTVRTLAAQSILLHSAKLVTPVCALTFTLKPSITSFYTMSNPIVFFDVKAGPKDLGRIEMTVRKSLSTATLYCPLGEDLTDRALVAILKTCLPCTVARNIRKLSCAAARRRCAEDCRELPCSVHWCVDLCV